MSLFQLYLLSYRFEGYVVMKDLNGNDVKVHFGWVSDDGVFDFVSGPRNREAPWPHINMNERTERVATVFGVKYARIMRRHFSNPKALTNGTLQVPLENFGLNDMPSPPFS